MQSMIAVTDYFAIIDWKLIDTVELNFIRTTNNGPFFENAIKTKFNKIPDFFIWTRFGQSFIRTRLGQTLLQNKNKFRMTEKTDFYKK